MRVLVVAARLAVEVIHILGREVSQSGMSLECWLRRGSPPADMEVSMPSVVTTGKPSKGRFPF
jgi:hypothetical protein